MGWISSLLEAIWNLLTSYVIWWMSVVLLVIDPLLMSIAKKLPNLNMETATFLKWSAFTNTWVPLDYGLTLVGCYFVFIGLVLYIKWILGLIPTIS